MFILRILFAIATALQPGDGHFHSFHSEIEAGTADVLTEKDTYPPSDQSDLKGLAISPGCSLKDVLSDKNKATHAIGFDINEYFQKNCDERPFRFIHARHLPVFLLYRRLLI